MKTWFLKRFFLYRSWKKDFASNSPWKKQLLFPVFFSMRKAICAENDFSSHITYTPYIISRETLLVFFFGSNLLFIAGKVILSFFEFTKVFVVFFNLLKRFSSLKPSQLFLKSFQHLVDHCRLFQFHLYCESVCLSFDFCYMRWTESFKFFK